MSNNEVPSDSSSDSFFSNILTPGSSLHPTFILILDASFAALFAVLVGLLFLTSGNIHFFALIMIELCLWGSVKWCVHVKYIFISQYKRYKYTGSWTSWKIPVLLPRLQRQRTPVTTRPVQNPRASNRDLPLQTLVSSSVTRFVPQLDLFGTFLRQRKYYAQLQQASRPVKFSEGAYIHALLYLVPP